MGRADYAATEEYVLSTLIRNLSPNLYFHGPHHTIDVLGSVGRLARSEDISPEDLLLLKTGALYHDTGFLEQYQNNEPIGARISQDSLPKFGYEPKEIEIVSGIIMSTQLPHDPKTKLEELMCDADLDNLGREDFYIKTEEMRRELTEYGTYNTPREWYEHLIPFLEEHNYFTKAAIDLRQSQKEKHLKEIKELLGIA